MTEENENVDPENPRPEGHYPRFRDNDWHYVPDELAQTISLGPGGDGEEGQDWVLTYMPEKRDPEDREKVLVRLTPRALHELYIEEKISMLRPDRWATGSSVISAVRWSTLTGRSRTPVARRVTSIVGPSIRVLRSGSVPTCESVFYCRLCHRVLYTTTNL